MEKMTVHPIFGAAYDKQEEQRDAMLASMKTFRPPTVCVHALYAVWCVVCSVFEKNGITFCI
jgi:hypothetical protein